MKHLLVITMTLSLAAPAFALSKDCVERQTDLFMEADAISIYNVQFNAYLKSIKKADQKAMAAEYQEDFDRRVVDLEQENDKFVADCVQ